MYQAIVAPVHVRPHPNADKLQIGVVSGHQVILGKDVTDGTVGVFFPPDGALSHEMARANNLYRKGKGENTNPEANGYLEENRRIKTLKLRGVQSEGLWLPLDSVAWAGLTPKVGDLIDDPKICAKYVSKATQRAIAQNKGKVSKNIEIPMFKEHYDTQQVRYTIQSWPMGARLIITEKLHGTSARTGNVLVEEPVTGWKETFNRYLGKYLGYYPPTKTWKMISGTRRTVIGEMHPDQYRLDIHKTFPPLRKGETVYYEIVGPGIMADHGVAGDDKDEVRKELKKRYGDVMRYAYGQAQGTYGVYVYRITLSTEDGHIIELAWDQVVARSRELGLKVVPGFDFAVERFSNAEDLLRGLSINADGASTLDPRHIREGVCVRVEHPDLFGRAFKYKGFAFCHLEGIAKNSDEYVDVEDAA